MAFVKKINDAGEYTRFPGVTVIAPVESVLGNENDIWQKIFNSLRQSTLLTEYYSLLPYQSYHMTTCHLYTESGCKNDWNTFIRENSSLFQQMDLWLKANQFSPTTIITDSLAAGALQIILKLPDEQKTLIEKFAKEFNIEGDVPSYFHITCAYGYKDCDDEEQYNKLQSEFARIITPYINQQIQLNAPVLSTFETMCKFTPWDGRANPFAPTNFVDLAYRFFSRIFYPENKNKASALKQSTVASEETTTFRKD
jgi:hypothetical protein